MRTPLYQDVARRSRRATGYRDLAGARGRDEQGGEAAEGRRRRRGGEPTIRIGQTPGSDALASRTEAPRLDGSRCGRDGTARLGARREGCNPAERDGRGLR